MAKTDLTLVQRIVHSVRLVGLWLDPQQKQIHNCAKIAIFLYLSVYVLQIIALLIAKDDPERLFECFSVISFSGMGILKLYSLHRHRGIWQRLLNRMSELETFDVTSDQCDEEEVPTDFVKQYTNKFRRVSTTLLTIYRFTGVIYIFSPFVEYGLFSYLGHKPAYPHILPNWSPFVQKHIGFYITMILFEAVAAFYCLAMHIAFDCAAIGVMVFVCDQFSALNFECSKIGGSDGKLFPTAERDAKAHLRIIRCHKKHISLIKSTKDLDDLLCNILGVYIFLATLTLCTISMRITSDQMTVMQMVSLLQYMCGTLIQLFLYCSYGHDVQNESSLDAGPLSAEYWSISPKVRRELAMLGFGMMLPRKLHAGPFHRLDLATFIQIVRTAYNCYALLGKVK